MKFNTKYNLRRTDSKKPEKIYLICRYNGKKFVYPTPHNVLPKHWNNKAGEIKNVLIEISRNDINGYLGELKSEAHRLYNTSTAQRLNITNDLLKRGLDEWNGYNLKEVQNFNSWVLDYIEKSPDRINPKTGGKISFRTIQEYKTTNKYLLEFQNENRVKIDFGNIDINTLIDFRDYLTTIKEFSVNNIAKHIDNVRQFLRAATAAKIEIDIDTINPSMLRVARENAKSIYLNEKELELIYNIDLSHKPTHDRVRDLFAIGCNTGLRISDYNNIQPHNIKGDTLHIIQQKTGDPVYIPIHKIVSEIFAKYNGIAPPKISDQKLNKYIKEVCQMAKISDPIEVQKTKAGERTKKVLLKWQLVTSHTARRSFASNLIKRGVPVHLIMAMTGHKKESVFLKYVKISPMEYGEMLREYQNKTTVKTA